MADCISSLRPYHLPGAFARNATISYGPIPPRPLEPPTPIVPPWKVTTYQLLTDRQITEQEIGLYPSNVGGHLDILA